MTRAASARSQRGDDWIQIQPLASGDPAPPVAAVREA